MVAPRQQTGIVVARDRGNIALRDLVFILFRRRWVVLAIALPIIALGGTSLFRQAGSYTATARVVVELTNVDSPRWDTNNRAIDFDRELSTLYTIAMSMPVAEMAAESLADSAAVIEALNPALTDLENEEKLANYLMGGVDVSTVGESNVLEFRFSSVHPRISLMAVGAMRDAFMEFQVHGRKNRQAVQYYEEQMASIRARIDSLLSLRGQVLSEHQYISLTDDLRHDSGNLAPLRGELAKTQVERMTMEAKRDQLVPYLDGDPRDFPMGPDENKSATLIGWRNTVGKHDDELASILTVYNRDSETAKLQMELIRESLAKEERSYVESIRVGIRSLEEKEKAIQGQIDDILAKSETAPLVYHQVSLVDTELGSLRKVLDDIQGKLGEVRMNEFADERVSNVVALSMPEISTVISGSKTVFYFVLIVLFSLALGLVVAFILESLDHRIYEPRDVEDRLQLPVFASVTKVE